MDIEYVKSEQETVDDEVVNNTAVVPIAFDVPMLTPKLEPKEEELMLEDVFIEDGEEDDDDEPGGGDASSGGCLWAFPAAIMDDRDTTVDDLTPNAMSPTIRLAIVSGRGVWTLETIRETTVLGPYEKSAPEDPEIKFSDWMCNVHYACEESEGNVVTFFDNGTVYYLVVRTIAAGEKLLFWHEKQNVNPYEHISSVSVCVQISHQDKVGCCVHCKKEFPGELYAKTHENSCSGKTSSLSNNERENSSQIENSKRKLVEKKTKTEVRNYRNENKRKNSRKICSLCSTNCNSECCISKLRPENNEKPSEERKTVKESRIKVTKLKMKAQVSSNPKKNTFPEDNSGELNMQKTDGNHYMYKCPMCTYTSYYGEKPSKCKCCNYETTNSQNCINVQKEPEGPPYKCKICVFSTMRRYSLKRHIRIHTGYKPHACNECGYRTDSRSRLKRHSLKHAKCKPFPCPLCSFKAATKKTLRNHTGKEHPMRRPKHV